MDIAPGGATAPRAAVPLAPVARLTDPKWDPASAAEQQVQQHSTNQTICHQFPGQIAPRLASSGRDLSRTVPRSGAYPAGAFSFGCSEQYIVLANHAPSVRMTITSDLLTYPR